MSSAKDIAKGFTISGLLDDASRTRKSYPVFEIDLAAIEDHPGNSVYSMDETAIARLTESIRKQGLTDLPLVRKLESGAYQMVSGHRRKAAYTLLAATDPAFEKLPCRVIEGVTDEESVTLLHAANYFTRSLTLTERAAATRALGVEVERRRAEDDTLTGVRTEDECDEAGTTMLELAEGIAPFAWRRRSEGRTWKLCPPGALSATAAPSSSSSHDPPPSDSRILYLWKSKGLSYLAPACAGSMLWYRGCASSAYLRSRIGYVPAIITMASSRGSRPTSDGCMRSRSPLA